MDLGLGLYLYLPFLMFLLNFLKLLPIFLICFDNFGDFRFFFPPVSCTKVARTSTVKRSTIVSVFIADTVTGLGKRTKRLLSLFK